MSEKTPPVPHSKDGDAIRADPNFANPKVQAALANLVDVLNANSSDTFFAAEDAKKVKAAIAEDESSVQHNSTPYSVARIMPNLAVMRPEITPALRELLEQNPDSVKRLQQGVQGTREEFSRIDAEKEAEAQRRSQQQGNGRTTDKPTDFAAQYDATALSQVDRMREVQHEVREVMSHAFKPLPPVTPEIASQPAKGRKL